ncbi:MAG: P-loop NTPase [Pseudomonadota bacterium]
MTKILGLISQKGGVGKSTLARAIACEAHQAELSVKIADFDLQQGTFTKWHQRRLQADLSEVGSVEMYKSVRPALEAAEGFDLLIMDGEGRASEKTLEIAKVADLVIIPCGVSNDDTEPTCELAKALVDKGIPRKKIVVTLSRVGSDASANRAREDIEARGFTVVDGYIPEKTSYSDAQYVGKSILETRHQSVNDKSQTFIDTLIEIILKV